MRSLFRLPTAAGSFVAVLAVSLAVVADGPADNLPDKVRPIPPAGAKIAEADASEIRATLADLKKELDSLPEALKGKPDLLELIPDVEIYHKAGRYAVDYNEMYVDPKKGGRDDVKNTKAVVKAGLQRAKELKEGKPTWTTATGPVVRGYRSKIDGSAQPYGMVVPKQFAETPKEKRRLDFWWHGRGENLTEVDFINTQSKSAGQFTPDNAFVLHPYGRYCNANKFAGEVDTFEALEHAKKHYAIDDLRLTARGFSMGGAACWQFATHFPTMWAAAAPGAGFAETKEFLGNFQNEKVKPTWYEERLWHMYDATDYAQNIFNVPTVAYSGADDKQKQAADIMAREMKKVGLKLNHIIGPKTGHSYEKGAKVEINKQIDAILAKGRDPFPKEIKFVTYTLQYNKCAWVEITGLEKHWAKATVNGTYADGKFDITTTGVTRFNLTLSVHPSINVTVNGRQLVVNAPIEKPEVRVYEAIGNGNWNHAAKPIPQIAKQPGLQGPIDDAFLSSFVMVYPTGKPYNAAVGDWVAAESKHAVEHWRNQFRGDARTKNDTDVTEADIKDSNLILWGDPSSNKVLAKIAEKLPIQWPAEGIVFGDINYNADIHALAMIYPNPLNPAKYVVINSGFTFREYDYLNNARQVPKLPDYAVIDVSTPPNSRWPGRVAHAGFFGEKWELQKNDGK